MSSSAAARAARRARIERVYAALVEMTARDSYAITIAEWTGAFHAAESPAVPADAGPGAAGSSAAIPGITADVRALVAAERVTASVGPRGRVEFACTDRPVPSRPGQHVASMVLDTLRTQCAARGHALAPVDLLPHLPPDFPAGMRNRNVVSHHLTRLWRVRRHSRPRPETSTCSPLAASVGRVRVTGVSGRSHTYWYPTAAPVPAPPDGRIGTYKDAFHVAVGAAEAALGLPPSLSEIARWRDAHVGRHPAADRLVVNRLGAIAVDGVADMGGKGAVRDGPDAIRLRVLASRGSAPGGWVERFTTRLTNDPTQGDGTRADGARTGIMRTRRRRAAAAHATEPASPGRSSDGAWNTYAGAARLHDAAIFYRLSDEIAGIDACRSRGSTLRSPLYAEAAETRAAAVARALRGAMLGCDDPSPSHAPPDVGTAAAQATRAVAVLNEWLNAAAAAGRVNTGARYLQARHLARAERHIAAADSFWRATGTASTAAEDPPAGVDAHGKSNTLGVEIEARVALIGTSAAATAIPADDLGPMLDSLAGGHVERLVTIRMTDCRRVAPPSGRTVPPVVACLDRVDALVELLGPEAGPRVAALLAAASTLLGDVVRDRAWLRGLIARAPAHDRAGRRAAVVALGLLGETVPVADALVSPGDPLDVAAACLAAILAVLTPATPDGAFPSSHGRMAARRARPPLDLAPAIRMLHAIEAATLGPDGADAAFEVATAALQRVRAGRWLAAVERE